MIRLAILTMALGLGTGALAGGSWVKGIFTRTGSGERSVAVVRKVTVEASLDGLGSAGVAAGSLDGLGSAAVAGSRDQLGSAAVAGSRVQILPEPVSVTDRAGVFRFTAATKILVLTSDPEVVQVVTGFADWWVRMTGTRISVEVRGGLGKTSGMTGATKSAISAGNLATDDSKPAADSLADRLVMSLGPVPGVSSVEGYLLDISRRRVRITAPGAAGLFYALESLRQLVPVGAARGAAGGETGGRPEIPCALILDYPRYAYRGMHLDVSRHFFDVAFIKKYLEILASYKINTFHWHLTDSHGWRLEIKQYPRLTSVGAWRADRTGIPMTIAEATGKEEPARYGGYYTQDEVRDVIRFAKERFITIVPEIEMPGHCTAALVAYPQFSDLNNSTPLLMPCGYPGDLQHNFCAGYDSTFIFLENILKEVMELFPSPLIHIGGDEVRGGPWLSCPRCQQRMKENGLTTARQLQAWFTQRIDSFISASGRKMIGWDEILESNLRPGGAVMSWHGDIGVRAGAAKGLGVVMSPYHYTYFDFYQSDPQLEPDITYAALSLDTVYSFDPTPPGLTEEERKHILGGEACLWTENIATPERVEYMLLPRLLALSEVLWSAPERKDYDRFILKTEGQFARLDVAGIHYATSLYNVGIRPSFDSGRKSVAVALSSQARKYEIRYTLDGRAPSVQSPRYGGVLKMGDGMMPEAASRAEGKTKGVGIDAGAEKTIDLKTALFKEGKRMGKINEDSFALHKGMGAVLRSSRMLPNDGSALPEQAALLDGIFGTVEPYDGRWVRFTDSLVTLTVDLGSRQPVHSVRLHCMEDQVGNIFLPRQLIIEGSEDGNQYKVIKDVSSPRLPTELLRHVVSYRGELKGTTAVRYIRVTLRNANLFAEADKNLLLVDEIVIR